MIEWWILGLIVFGINVTLYIDYQADKRMKILAKHLDPLIAKVDSIESRTEWLVDRIDVMQDALDDIQMSITDLHPDNQNND